MTLWELAHFLKGQGVINAINLDGGGSSTYVANGSLTCYPSDHCVSDPMWCCPQRVSTILCVHHPVCPPSCVSTSPSASLRTAAVTGCTSMGTANARRAGVGLAVTTWCANCPPAVPTVSVHRMAVRVMLDGEGRTAAKCVIWVSMVTAALTGARVTLFTVAAAAPLVSMVNPVNKLAIVLPIRCLQHGERRRHTNPSLISEQRLLIVTGLWTFSAVGQPGGSPDQDVSGVRGSPPRPCGQLLRFSDRDQWWCVRFRGQRERVAAQQRSNRDGGLTPRMNCGRVRAEGG
ncbi:uncharacterized protein LOC110513910 isoform X1 [Oncorhynchus mykiss]|uniref:uncharacterized protein LOC110513910 isoform X1 n=1 Tax=Oncorhynchus mykiss TaxID=8022 RepID=UPI0018777C21|nr:uncharacterized protein LOC110513910 isoform X1 [Oncorhynchus mykiss]